MRLPELLSQAKALADQASAKAEEYSGVIGTVRGFIVENFGETGLIASYIALSVLVLFIVSRIGKLTFSAIKYLIIPALALAFLASLFLPYSFAATLPVSVTVCSLFLLFKG
jgi:hypothetical protein